jgi:hypothetical protein
MRRFEMVRASEDGKASNKGKVLEGIVFSDGTCVVRWSVDGQPDSTAVWNSFADFEAIHVAARPGKERTSEIRWLDEDSRD